MGSLDFIKNNIGKKVFITNDGDLGMCGELRKLIFEKTELTIVRLTKSGMAYLTDGKNFYSVPPKNVCEFDIV